MVKMVDHKVSSLPIQIADLKVYLAGKMWSYGPEESES